MRSDPIADLLTRIRNASNAEHEKVDIPSSRLKVRIAELLKDEGFIKNFRVLEDGRQGMLRVYLKYGTGNEKMISGLVRVSTPGRRVYVTHDKIPSILAGMGVALLSTSRGVFTYLTNEADSLSRAHQRLLFEHFREVRLRRLAPLALPADSADDLWADSMVLIGAYR